MSTMILLGNKKEIHGSTVHGASCGAIPVTTSGQMKRTMSSGASSMVTRMTMIVRMSYSHSKKPLAKMTSKNTGLACGNNANLPPPGKISN